ncbi:MAG TPA: GtrA family protein [Candidatus Acidoferrales bacterium]|nr:GtrA family protein [Candidatus Acidoferrales bacterium]
MNSPCQRSLAIVRRWMKFNLVGAMGICVQLLAVYFFAFVFSANALVATTLGVEAAVLHNFFWHEHFTWSDRRAIASEHATFVLRLLAFNCTTGTISIGGNLVFVSLLIFRAHTPLLVANAAAIAACSLLNFAVNDRIIFRGHNNVVPALNGPARLSARAHAEIPAAKTAD